MCSPRILLVAALQQVVASVPHFVVLPHRVGSQAELNLLAAVAAPSSGGKDRALDAARPSP